ncbi:MAG TPA: hypothetical protein VF516_24340 [Kofleriaceae bacterium]
MRKPCDPQALLARCRKPGSNSYDDARLDNAARQVADAIERGADEHWKAPAMAAAYRILEKSSWPRSPQIEAAARRLLSRAPLKVVVGALHLEILRAKTRQIALDRARRLSTDIVADADRYVSNWLDRVRSQAHSPYRGELRVFEGSCGAALVEGHRHIARRRASARDTGDRRVAHA